MLTPDQKASCAAKKDKFCRSPVGQLLNNVAKPASAFSGGLITGCCPPSATDPLAPNPEDLKKPATDAEGAAARIKQLEAGAAARRSAVRYLGTVNCKRFPEAETALIGALRTDTNECVRFEAAVALARGCCCTTKTVKALTLTVEGLETDGNPAETSARVRAMAAQALARCSGVTAAAPTPIEPPPELPPERPAADATVRKIDAGEREKVLADARRALAGFQAQTMPGMATGRRTVIDTIRYASALAAPTPMAMAPPVPAPVAVSETMEPAIIPASATLPAAPDPKPVTGLPPTGKRGLFDLIRSSATNDR